jgi:transcriptional antiterminator RfaH
MKGRVRIRRRSWLVCRTEPRKEHWAVENIKRQGLTYYLPICCELDRGTLRESLLFPGYVFVKAPKRRWASVASTYGILDVVMVGTNPAWLEDTVVDALQASQNEAGVVMLPDRPTARFAKGQKVKLRSGPFLGYIGIYEGSTRSDRERVLLSLLGRVTPLDVASDQIEEAVDGGQR